MADVTTGPIMIPYNRYGPWRPSPRPIMIDSESLARALQLPAAEPQVGMFLFFRGLG